MILRLLAASLRHRFRQLLLIMVAVAVAAATVSTLAGFSLRVERGLAANLAAFGPNLTVRPQVGGAERLAGGEVERVREVPGVEAAAGFVRLERSASVVGTAGGVGVRLVSQGSGALPVVAMDRELLELHPTWKLRGAWPGPGEVLLGADVVAPAALEKGEDRSGGRWRVSGTLVTGEPLDRAVVVPLASLVSIPGAVAAVDRIEVRADRERLAEVAASIEATVAGAEARPLLRVSLSEASLSRRVALLLSAVSLVSLLLAFLSVGAATTALMDERREEAGLMMALGLTGRGVTKIFAAELLTVAAFSGLVGEVAGEVAARSLAHRVFSVAAPASGITLTWAGLAAAVAVAVLVVGTAVIVALRRIERLEPARVLRGE